MSKLRRRSPKIAVWSRRKILGCRSRRRRASELSRWGLIHRLLRCTKGLLKLLRRGISLCLERGRAARTEPSRTLRWRRTRHISVMLRVHS